jgi:hypothetical protein
MFINTAIKVLIKYTEVLSVVLTHCPVARRLPADLSLFFLLLEFLNPWILLKLFFQARVVDF